MGIEFQKFAIGYIEDSAGDGKHFKSKEEFLDFIIEHINEHLTVKDIYVFAHNAIYDFQGVDLIDDFIDGDDIFSFKRTGFYMLDSLVYVKYKRRFKQGDKKYTQHLIFMDTFQHLLGSLSRLAKDFLGEEKQISKEVYDYSAEDWNKWLDEGTNKYDGCKVDTQQLIKIMKIFFDFLKEHNIPFSFSLPSNGFGFFRTQFLKDTLLFPNSPEYVKDVLEGYRGGFVNALRLGGSSDMNYYDVNSLYATAMYNKKIPTRYYNTLQNVDLEKYKELKKKYYIIAKLTFSYECDVSFIVKKLKNKLIPIKAGNVVLHEPEIDYLISHGANINFETVYLYHSSEHLFDDYINLFYSLKKKADEEHRESVRYISKTFLTSLYGKFGQNKRHTKYISKSNKQVLKEPLRYYLVEGETQTLYTDYGRFLVKTEKQKIPYSPEIAGAVTAYARMILAGYVEEAGVKNTIYCDTDSLITSADLDKYINAELGGLKVVERGNFTIYAPKVYADNIGFKAFKGVNPNKNKMVDGEPNTYIVPQFSKTKNVNKGVITVKYRKKKMSFVNDKLKYIENYGYSYTESEFLEVQQVK